MRLKHRIAYLLTPVEFGGAEKVSLNFLQSVDRQLFDIYPILFFRPWEEDTSFLKELMRANFPIYKIPVSLGKQDFLWLIRRFKITFSILMENHFDLLHTHGYVADIIGIMTAKMLRVRTISTCHGFIENDKKLSRYNALDRLVLRFCDTIIAVSADIQRSLTDCGIKANRIKVIPNAVRTDIDKSSLLNQRQEARQLFGFSEEDCVLGYVGRLSPEKGLTYLIESAALARNANCPVKMLIIGEGPEQGELRNTVKRRGLESHAVFAGFQTIIDGLLPAIDIFILPSLTEGTPMSLLEAMAYGIPAIASTVGQIPEIIDSGKSGILVRPEDAEQMKDAIVFLCNKPSVRESIGKAGRKKVKRHFDIKNWTRKIENEYLNLIENKSRQR